MKFLAWHLGLGDAIAMAPLAVMLAEKEDLLIVPVLDHNYVSVSSFFVNHSNIHPLRIKAESEMSNLINNHDSILLGNYGPIPPLEGESFIEWHFRGANVDIKDRWKYCPLQKASENFKWNQIYPHGGKFIHDDISRGFDIRPEYRKESWFSPGVDEKGILAYSEVIYELEEIHCIDSSFLHLTEALKTKGKLFYHKYARKGDMNNYKFRKHWEIIE